MWQKITVWQYQQMYPIITNPSKEWTDKDIEHKLIAIINNLTENQVNQLTKNKLDKLRSELYFLKDNYEGVPVKRIVANKRIYKFIKDAKDINTARYIETKFFMKDLIPNLHKVAASIVMPQERKWFKYIDLKYDTEQHQEYANDILYANFKEVYFSVVFFYQLFKDWIPITKDYLITEMNNQGLAIDKAEKVGAILWSILDGNTVQK